MAELRELHDAFAALEQQSPRSCSLPVVRQRRRFVLPVAAAAVVVAAAIAPILLLHKDNHPGAPALTEQPAAAPTKVALTPSHGDWRSEFSLTAPPSWTISSQSFWYDRQEVDLTGPSDAYCSVSHYPAGAFTTSSIGSPRTPISIGGYSGVYAAVTDSGGDYPSVALRYPHGASWLIATCRKGSVDPRADAELLAARVHLGGGPLTLPFRIGYLPAGFTSYFATGKTGTSRPGANGTPLATAVFTPATSRDAGGLQLDVTAGLPNSRSGKVIDINGQPATLDGPVLTLPCTGYTVTLTAGPQLASPEDGLIRTARGLQLATNPLDYATWFDASKALP
jgi:hypothetical protein